jgi:predicted phage terminase large subunit-like protein
MLNLHPSASDREEALASWLAMDPETQARTLRMVRADIGQRPHLEYGDHCRRILADRGYAPAAHHERIMDKVESVINGTGPKRLLITAPPGSAKSTYTSELLPTHLMNRWPRFNLIGASNTGTLAEDFSDRSLAIIEQYPQLMKFHLRRKSAPLWTTREGGRYRAAGVGAAIAGNRADGALIDDPVRGREDADSEIMRERVWNWFISDLRTRLKPGAWIIVIMTRWHEDDLGGRLLDRQKGLWEVLSLPAQAWGPDADGLQLPDALGRKPGEWLWGDDAYGYGNALQVVRQEYEQAGAMRDWAALYECRPSGGEGAVFKTTQLVTHDAAPKATGAPVRAWDLAATKKVGTSNPDWTVGVKMQRNADDTYTILDVVRIRGGPDEVEAAIVNTAKADGRKVRVKIPQDPGQAGKSQVKYLAKQLAGYRLEAVPVTGDKATRAAPAAAQVNVGNVSLLRASWNAAFREELSSFPSGTHDDQVDAFADAFGMVALRRPLAISAATLRDMKYGLGR